MAKKKPGEPNKSQAIRDYKSANPNSKPKQIAEELTKEGIEVSPGFVSTILSTSKKKKSVRRPGRPKGSTKTKTVRAVGRPSKNSGGEVSYESLVRIKKIVDEVGGIDEARNALSALEQLTK